MNRNKMFTVRDMLLTSIGVLCLSRTCFSLPEVIKIAGLFDTTSGAEEAAFLRAVTAVNVGRYPSDDSFKGSKSLCDLITPGVAAMFGPTTSATSSHVEAVASQLHVPFMQFNFDYIKERSDFSINVHPHPRLLGKAFADFVKDVGWKSFIVLYETEDGLVKIQELLKPPKTFVDVKITLRQLTPG